VIESPGLEPVPTVPELHTQGLATVVERSKRGTFYRLTPAGAELLDGIMRRNGLIGRQREDERQRLARARRRLAAHRARDWAADAFSEDTPPG
jgi:hypothetical protein